MGQVAAGDDGKVDEMNWMSFLILGILFVVLLMSFLL